MINRYHDLYLGHKMTFEPWCHTCTKEWVCVCGLTWKRQRHLSCLS